MINLKKLLSNLVYLAFVSLYIWGVGWSFYRYGPVDGGSAIAIPPYAWYRGVAAIWEEPKWKESYDLHTEEMVLYIKFGALWNLEPQMANSALEISHSLKKWLKDVPASERSKLKDSCRAYNEALAEFTQQYFIEYIDGNVQPHPENSALVKARVERFSSVKSLSDAWNILVRDASELPKTFDPAVRRAVTTGELDESKRAIVQNMLRTNVQEVNERIARNIDDLFSQ